jgi:hypothetical protein
LVILQNKKKQQYTHFQAKNIFHAFV